MAGQHDPACDVAVVKRATTHQLLVALTVRIDARDNFGQVDAARGVKGGLVMVQPREVVVAADGAHGQVERRDGDRQVADLGQDEH